MIRHTALVPCIRLGSDEILSLALGRREGRPRGNCWKHQSAAFGWTVRRALLLHCTRTRRLCCQGKCTSNLAPLHGHMPRSFFRSLQPNPYCTMTKQSWVLGFFSLRPCLSPGGIHASEATQHNTTPPRICFLGPCHATPSSRTRCEVPAFQHAWCVLYDLRLRVESTRLSLASHRT